MRRILGILVLGAALTAPSSALATSVLGAVDLDWSGFTFSTTPGLSLTFSDDSFGGIFGVDVGDFGDLVANSAVASPVAGLSPAGMFFEISDGSATSIVSTDPTALPDAPGGPTGFISAIGTADAPTIGPVDFVNTSVFRMLEVGAVGDGTATFTVPYALTVEMSASSIARVQLDATLGIVDLIGPFPGAAFSNSGTFETLTSFSVGLDKVDALAGVLSFSVDLFDGDIVQVGVSGRVDLRNVDPVPLPAAFWLMLGACGALLGRRRNA